MSDQGETIIWSVAGGTVDQFEREALVSTPEGVRYIYEVADDRGEMQRLVEISHEPDFWVAADIAGIDWDELAKELEDVTRQLEAAVSEPDDERRADHYVDQPGDYLDQAGRAFGGGYGLLAKLAIEVAREQQPDRSPHWGTLGPALAVAPRWARLLRDPRADLEVLVQFIASGTSIDTVERSRADGDSGPPGPSGAGGFTVAIAGESDSKRASRAARQTRLPASAIIWAVNAHDLGSHVALTPAGMWVARAGLDSGLALLSAGTGALLRSREHRGVSSLEVEDGQVFAQVDRNLCRLGPDDAEPLWAWPAQPYSHFVAGDGKVLLLEQFGPLVSSATKVTCLKAATGEELWSIPGTSSRPRLELVGFAEGLAWLCQRQEDEYFCLGVDDEGQVRHTSPIGGSGGKGRIVLGTISTRYRSAQVAELVAGRNDAWGYGPYPLAGGTDGNLLWYESRSRRPPCFQIGTVADRGPVIETGEVPVDGWVGAAGAFFCAAPLPALYVLSPRGLGKRACDIPSPLATDGTRIWCVARHLG